MYSTHTETEGSAPTVNQCLDQRHKNSYMNDTCEQIDAQTIIKQSKSTVSKYIFNFSHSNFWEYIYFSCFYSLFFSTALFTGKNNLASVTELF